MNDTQKQEKKKVWFFPRRSLAMILAAAMLLSMTVLFAGCKKDEKDPADETEEVTEAAEGGKDAESDGKDGDNGEKEDEPEETIPSGWVEDEAGNVLYYAEGEPCVGFFHNEQTGYYVDREFAPGWYYFDEDGFMVTDSWIESAGSLHYISENGTAAAAGWYSDSKGWYYLEEQGKLLTNQVFRQEDAQYSVDVDGYLFLINYDQIESQEATEEIDGNERTVLMLPEAMDYCIGFTFTYESQLGVSPKVWTVLLRRDGEWVDMKENFTFEEEDGFVTVKFQEPVSFDACCVYAAVLVDSVDSSLLNVLVCY